MTQSALKIVSNELFFQQVAEYLDQGKEVVFSLRGSSMTPFLKEGDLVTVKPLTGIQLKIGHIVLAHSAVGYVLHRIVRMDKNFIYLAGDANFVQIEMIERKALIAFLIGASRNDEKISLYQPRILCYARIWYYARPLRRIWAKMCKQLRK